MRSMSVVVVVLLCLLAVMCVADPPAATYYGYGNPSAPPSVPAGFDGYLGYGVSGGFTDCSVPFTVSYAQQLSALGLAYNPSVGGDDIGSREPVYMALASVDSAGVYTAVARANQGGLVIFPGYTEGSTQAIAYFEVGNFAYTPTNFTGLLQPGTQYAACMSMNTESLLAIYYELGTYPPVEQFADIIFSFTTPFTLDLPSNPLALYTATVRAAGHGDPVFTGFNGEKFNVKGLPGRVYNVLSLPTLQLNTRFIPIKAGQAMNSTEQSAVRRRVARLVAALGKRAGGSDAAGGTSGTTNRLPSTTSWSHNGLYMGETGVQLAGIKLLVKPGAYATGFATVELDGVPVPVSGSPVQLPSGSSVLRWSPSELQVNHSAALFTLVNSDHFVNIHSAELRLDGGAGGWEHVDGLLGQTVHASFHVERSAAFTRHVENDFLLPKGDDVWSTAFEHNQYTA